MSRYPAPPYQPQKTLRADSTVAAEKNADIFTHLPSFSAQPGRQRLRVRKSASAYYIGHTVPNGHREDNQVLCVTASRLFGIQSSSRQKGKGERSGLEQRDTHVRDRRLKASVKIGKARGLELGRAELGLCGQEFVGLGGRVQADGGRPNGGHWAVLGRRGGPCVARGCGRGGGAVFGRRHYRTVVGLGGGGRPADRAGTWGRRTRGPGSGSGTDSGWGSHRRAGNLHSCKVSCTAREWRFSAFPPWAFF